MKNIFINIFCLALCQFCILHVIADEDVVVDDENLLHQEVEEVEVNYVTPKALPNAYFMETFDDIPAVDKRWVKSRAKKENVDEDIAKYDGVWAVEPTAKDALPGDRGLVLKSKAKHAAISAAFTKKFVFKDKPLVVQYEVNLQNGQECGGAYIKLLSGSNKGAAVDLAGFRDKTPYTIMFGPDKCGNDNKFHFIFRHVNPLTKEIEEKHCKRPSGKIEELFKDKRPHLLTLILQPDNTFEVLLDHQVINSGNLLEDFTPPVNPEKEIDDPSESKPEDWDEREKIPDSDSKKPEDWDEDAPMQIIDTTVMKPDGWLDDEPELIPDPSASKPEDWDDDMDGEWEAPLVANPKCKEAAGCGEWRAPLIDNPYYKGKWKPTMINNPNYKGKWMPRKIPNPDYFEDLEPFKMTPIAAIGIELWSMSDEIYFDNFLITDNTAEAYQFSTETFDLKILKLEKGQKGYINQIVEFSNKNPWIYGVYVLSLAIPVVLIYVCCCAEDVKSDKDADKKKTDEPSEDDPQVNEEEEDEEAEGEEQIAENIDELEDVDAKEANDDQDDISASDKEPSKSDEDTRKSPRLRKVRKE